MKHIIAITLFLFTLSHTFGQEDACLFTEVLVPTPGTEAVIEAKNGYSLPTAGEIRILVIYAEVNYDVNPQLDRFPNGTAAWPVGQLPTYKDNMFDLNWTGTPQQKMTRYYDECSFGNYRVLGDYFNAVITVDESTVGSVSFGAVVNNAVAQINAMGVLNTHGGSTFSDLDHWQEKGIGQPGVNAPDAPHMYDHVMFIVRNNHQNSPLSGYASSGSFGTLLSYQANTHSVFNGGKSHPFSIVRHEFDHLLFGGNDYHNGGSHSAGGRTFVGDQGGWSMLGGSSSSFLTCNGWDRNRFDWRAPGTTFNISTFDQNNVEVNTDLDATNPAHAGTYILRDFATTGDVLRIKLPFIPAGEKQQYLWVENHQGKDNNNSEFDQYYWNATHPCTETPEPGLFMYIQAGKENKIGGIYNSQRGHYIRHLSADGMYEIAFENDSVINPGCVVGGAKIPAFEKKAANPLTGWQDQEQPAYDLDNDNVLEKGDQRYFFTEKIGNIYEHDLPVFGQKRHSYNLGSGKHMVGVGTNPSSNSMVNQEHYTNGNLASNTDNRAVRINGISIEIVNEMANGSIEVKVKFDQTDINNNVRWAANDIQLPPVAGSNGYSLNLTQGNALVLVQGHVPTRVNNPITINGERLFTDPTHFTVQTGANMNVESNATLGIAENSTMTLQSGSKLEIQSGGTLLIYQGELIVEDGAELILHDGAKLIVDLEGKLTINNTTVGTGLIVGDNTVTNNQAEVQVIGTLEFAPNAIWDHRNSGFYNFFGNHVLNLPASVPVKIKGLGKTVKHLELQSGAVLHFNGNLIEWSDALVHYGFNSSVQMYNQASFRGTNVAFNGQLSSSPASIALDIENPLLLVVLQCDLQYFNRAISVRNAEPSLLLLANTYNNNNTSVYVNNVKKAQIAGSTLSGNLNGVHAVNSGIIRVTNSEIIGFQNGAQLDAVVGAYFVNSKLHYNTTGISGNDALVFLRSGTEVDQNTVGVELFGRYDYNLANYTSMLTVGDIACASIFSNGVGVHGHDVILNIDAEQHAIDRGSPNSVFPNRFNDNLTYAFDVCYTDVSVAPTQINALGNFWGTPSGTLTSNDYRIKTNTDCIAKPNHGNNIPLVMTSYSTCIATNSCTDCVTAPGTNTPGGGNGQPSHVALNVRNAFQNANAPFQVEDKVLTRLGFSDISDVGLVKDTTDGSWNAISIDNEVLAVETESVHRIQVSKAIKAASNGNRSHHVSKNIFTNPGTNNDQASSFSLYPNPAHRMVNINVEDDQLYTYRILNVLGAVMDAGTFTRSTQINTTELDGVYMIELVGTNGVKHTQTFVVNQ